MFNNGNDFRMHKIASLPVVAILLPNQFFNIYREDAKILRLFDSVLLQEILLRLYRIFPGTSRAEI